jgi:hypothetical protein
MSHPAARCQVRRGSLARRIRSQRTSWDTRAWPLLVDLDMVAEGNPHTKKPSPCVGVCIGSARVGYFTSAMTDRYRQMIESGLAEGARVTANASAYQGTKSGTTFWRLRVDLPHGG